MVHTRFIYWKYFTFENWLDIVHVLWTISQLNHHYFSSEKHWFWCLKSFSISKLLMVYVLYWALLFSVLALSFQASPFLTFLICYRLSQLQQVSPGNIFTTRGKRTNGPRLSQECLRIWIHLCWNKITKHKCIRHPSCCCRWGILGKLGQWISGHSIENVWNKCLYLLWISARLTTRPFSIVQ